VDKMELDLKNRVIIVTGAARGIGKSIAQHFLEEKARVVICDINEKLIYKTVNEIKRSSKDCIGIRVDVSNKEEVNKMIEEVNNKYGRIDVLVNNAGVVGWSLIEEMNEGLLSDMINVNLKGSIYCSKSVIKIMKNQRYGKIINAASIVGLTPNVGLLAYSIAKSGVVMLTKVMAAEMAPYNINVNAYAPGVVETHMTRELRSERGEKKLKEIPLRRFARPEEIAKLVLFLSSDVSNYITGEIVNINGGQGIVSNPEYAYK